MRAPQLTELLGTGGAVAAGGRGAAEPAVERSRAADSPDLPGLAETLGVVDGFDDGLVHGLARVGDECGAALAALAGALAATPLGERVGEAVEKVVAGSIADEHLVALAGARTALLGAAHDALLARFDTALGRDRSPWAPATGAATDGSTATAAPGGSTATGSTAAPDSPAGAGSPDRAGAGSPVTLLAGARSWLRELAITGWRGVDHDLVSASAQLLPAVLAEPALRRLAVLLDGLVAELQAASPVSTMDLVPARRWADLWARAMLLAQPGDPTGDAAGAGAAPDPGRPLALVSGRLLPLGVDVHEHATAVQFQVHALLEPTGGGPVRLVRTSVAAAKVETIVGPAVWRVVRGAPVLLAALAERRALEVTELPLLPSGDLRWHDDRARPGEPADPFATARVLLDGALAPAVPPLDRHPVRIAEPVLVEGYAARVDDDSGAVAFDLGGVAIPVAVDRLPACGPLTRELVVASSACLGLVRWDAGRWSLHPFAVQATAKRRTVAVHGGDWAQGPTDAKAAKAAATAGDAVSVLRERAGRLLRR